MARDHTPGEFVTVVSLYCGACSELLNGAFDGVIGGPASEDDYGCLGPAPLYHVRQLTCPNCGAEDLYGDGDEGGAVYSHADLDPHAQRLLRRRLMPFRIGFGYPITTLAGARLRRAHRRRTTPRPACSWASRARTPGTY
jgi:hypothetical protein